VRWPHVPDIGSERYLVNLVRALPERAAITERALIHGPNIQFKMPDLFMAETRIASTTCSSTVTHIPHGLNFWERGKEKDGRPEDACTTVYLSFIIMGDVIPLPVVPPPLPSDWEQKPSQGNSISRE